MKKSVWIILIVAVLVVGGGVWWFVKDKNNSKNTASQSSNADFSVIEACKVFTLEDARQVLGAQAEEGTNVPDTTSGDVTVSSCSYTNAAANPADIRVATVLVRSPQTQAGVDSNNEYFTTQKPAGVQDVSGYGETAFWDPSTGQLNVLKNGTWTIIQIGSSKPSENTLEQAQQLADLIVPNL